MKLRLADSALPALKAGTYWIDIKHSFDIDGTAKVEPENRPIVICDPSARFDTKLIAAVYPPPGSKGSYAQSLPHIAFRRPTLPWEVDVEGQPPTMPWLLLICLHSDEFDTEGSTLILREGVNYRLEEKEIHLLAHVREGPQGTTVSVLCANRTCAIQEAKQSTAFLVSTKEYLNTKGPSGSRRLPFYYSWSFGCGTSAALPSTLYMVFEGAGLPKRTVNVRDIESAGLYRYHSPLCPAPELSTADRGGKYLDALLNEEYDLGGVEISRCAAFALGRILASGTPRYLAALEAWRDEVAEALRRAIAVGALPKTLSNLGPFDAREGGFAAAGHAALGSMFKGTLRGKDRAAIRPRPEAKGGETISMAARLPPAVRGFLLGLRRLEGVPIEYLFPDLSHPLEEGSLHFFFIQRAWTDALVAGALCAGGFGELAKAYLMDALPLIQEQLDREEGRLNEEGPILFGFVMRSAWAAETDDLQIRLDGYRGTGQTGSEYVREQAPLRTEKIAPETIIAISAVVPDRLIIEEPPKMLHLALGPKDQKTSTGFLDLTGLKDATSSAFARERMERSKKVVFELREDLPRRTRHGAEARE